MATGKVELTITGTALHPAARAGIMNRGLRDMMGIVTGHGVTVVRGQFEVFKHPTGHYESQTVADVTHTPFAVTDSGVIYGPWLEGESARNRSTRFKGYHSFRKATQKIARDVPRVVGPVVTRMVAQLNGGGR